MLGGRIDQLGGRGGTCMRKYRYAARLNISKRKMGKKVTGLYFEVLIPLCLKPGWGVPPSSKMLRDSPGGGAACKVRERQHGSWIAATVAAQALSW